MKKYAIALVLCFCILAFAGRGRYDPIFWRSVPGGIEYTGGDVTISGGNLVSSGGVKDLIPDANNTYDLGSTTNRWKELFVMGGSLHIGAFTLTQDAIDNDGLEFDGAIHSAAVNGISGNFCIHDGNEPAQSNSATGSRIWSDPNGVLKHQKSTNAGGGSKQVIVDDGAGNLGIGTTEPKRQFDFDGANVRTQRYFDSDLNTNLGYETFGAGNLSGTHNSAFGRHGLYSITSGSGNSGLGNEVLYSVTTGGNNVGVGSMSGKGVVGGSHNISLGYKSGYVIANGDNNISIGSYSNYVGTGSKNITIGYNIDLPADAGNNQLNIGNLIYGTGLDGTDKTVSTGNVGIGNATPTTKLEVNGRIKDKTGYVMPVGSLTPFAGSSAPDGWLLCDGSAKSTTTYADLFAVIGYTYGGSGGTFNVPNMADKNPMGVGTYALGNSGGSLNHDHTYNTVISHTHPVDPPNTSSTSIAAYDGAQMNDPQADWVMTQHATDQYEAIQTAGVQIGWNKNNTIGFVDLDDTHSHSTNVSAFTSSSTGSASGTTATNNAPYLVVNYIIKY